MEPCEEERGFMRHTFPSRDKLVTMPKTLRTEVVHYLAGAVPADKWVNVLYHVVPDGTDYTAHATAIENAFCTGPHRIYDGMYVDTIVYDMADATPRPERARVSYVPTTPLTMATISAPQVALCLSFYGTRNIPHQRGRLFIGPWSAGGVTGNPSTTECTAIANLGLDLQKISAAAAENTQVVRDKSGATYPVTNYWVDNRWDTQRRRLPKATTRVLKP